MNNLRSCLLSSKHVTLPEFHGARVKNKLLLTATETARVLTVAQTLPHTRKGCVIPSVGCLSEKELQAWGTQIFFHYFYYEKIYTT